MDPTQYFENRTKVLAKLAADGIDAYPHKFHVGMQLGEFVAAYGSSIAEGERKEDVTVNVAGRLTSVREQGKLVFFDLSGDGAKVRPRASNKSGGWCATRGLEAFRFLVAGGAALCADAECACAFFVRAPRACRFSS